MKLRQLIYAALLSALCLMPAYAVSFESDIQQGFVKKNAIVTEHFRLEFSDLIENQSDSDSDGISDTIELIAESAELSYEVLVEEMGYPAPNDDVDRRIMIILDDKDAYLSSGALGITSILSNGDPYVAIDPFLSEDLLKVTMAHEFYHVIQFDMGVDFAYYDQGINLAEATATWSEEKTYDEINDYVNYLNDFFTYPDYSVFSSYVPTGSLFEYALSIWPLYLTEQYDDDVILSIWEDYQGTDGVDYEDPLALYEIVSEILEDEGSSINEAYADFALWNLDLDFYSEGNEYPEVLLLGDLVMEELTLVDETYAPALYGSNYLYFENDESSDGFYFQIVKPDGVEFAVTLVPFEGGDYFGEKAERLYLDAYEDMDEAMSFSINGYDGVVAIVSALGADFDEVSDPALVFDEGYLYYYLAQYGEEPEIDTESVEVEEGEEKEGEEASAHSHDEVRYTNELSLEVLSYDEDSVTLSWNRPDSDIVLYDVWYTDGEYEDLDSWMVKTIEQGYITSSTVSDLEEGVNYIFEVYAYDEDEELVGDPSNAISITTEEWLFTDLSFLDSHYDAISSLVEMGIFEGYPDGSFQPNGVINRAELLKILIEGREINFNEAHYQNCFPDVTTDWYAPYVCYAKEQGWVSGYPDGTFRPGDTVNKVESLKILFNVYESGLVEGSSVDELPYPDLDENAWFAVYVDQASSLGILEETPGENFNPSDGQTRGNISEVLYRFLIQLARI